MKFRYVLLSMLFATPTMANHSWSTYHWARKTPSFTLQLGTNLKNTYTDTLSWRSLLTTTSQNWNSPTLFGWTTSPVIQTQIIIGGGGTNCSALQGTVQVCNNTYGNTGWLGLAQVWISGSHILQGVAKMNDSYFTTSSKYNTNNEKLHVMCQEVAHTFGLGHQSTNGTSLNTCMDYFMNIGSYALDTRSTTPNSHDFEQLALIYNHVDTFNSYAVYPSSTSTALTPTSNDPRSWGKLIRQSPEGRSSIYEMIQGNGIRIETHVTWTEEKIQKCTNCDHRFD